MFLQKFLGAALVFFCRTPLVNLLDLLRELRAGVEQSLLEIFHGHGAGCLTRRQFFSNELSNNVAQELAVRPPFRPDVRCLLPTLTALILLLICAISCTQYGDYDGRVLAAFLVLVAFLVLAHGPAVVRVLVEGLSSRGRVLHRGLFGLRGGLLGGG